MPANDSSAHRGPGTLLPRLGALLRQLRSERFPVRFAAGVLAAILICVVGIPGLYSVKPRNTLPKCLRQFNETDRAAAGDAFCHCIHTSGEPLAKCLGDLEQRSE